MTRIADTELDVHPLCLGGNVFGWTADEDASFAVLDAYTEAGGNFIDTADLYAGGESEKIIGRWLARRGRRDDLVIATKVGMAGDRANLRAATVRAAAEGPARFVALHPHYNLMERDFEGDLADLCARENLGVLPYFGLAKGFLTGKYRPGSPEGDSPRAQRARAYLTDRGLATLGVLDEVAAAHDTTVAAVALAWLLAQPTIVSPIASARTPEQLADLLPVADLRLTADELARLTDAAA